MKLGGFGKVGMVVMSPLLHRGGTLLLLTLQPYRAPYYLVAHTRVLPNLTKTLPVNLTGDLTE